MPLPQTNRELREWNYPMETTELHSDEESESWSEGSENLSLDSETEEYLPVISINSTSKSQVQIHVTASRSQVFNNCKVYTNDGENRRSRERHQEPTGILRERRVSTEANIDPSPISASENENLDNAEPSFQTKLEQLDRDTADLSEEYKVIEGHNNRVEQENIRLKRENELLRQRIASTSTTLPPENDENTPENDENTPENDENTPENDEDTPENDEDNGRNQTYTAEETPLQTERQEGYYEKICAFLRWLYALGVSVLQWTQDCILTVTARHRPMIAAAQVP